ncbi:efflux RND transporter periplasmic adaptor subunit [Epibacterium sp. SM1969]|uniref:Efflux RND transporter periplasmic adaptor subunit n=1 Tax=Tritonibacter aquimaris TaxID=2663379 RepID=A0A844AS74_9RHOB|nr:efflux RND transporter periplasmic adaptor subunit [Tritonibacter aquimaris]
MTFKHLLLPLLCSLALTPGALSAQSNSQSNNPPSTDILKPVKLMKIQSGPQQVERRFFGQVAAKETVDLAFQVAGQVFKMPVAEGETIPQGTMIAQLDLERFELQLEQAQLRKEQADRTKARNERLSGTVSQVIIEDTETEAKLADVSLRNARTDLRHATLLAPFDALIARREVALYTTVAAGAPIARIHDMSELHIEINVPEVLFQNSNESDTLTLNAQFPGSDIRYPVEILEYAAEASAVGQTFRVTLKMKPPSDRQILPGASTTVNVVVKTGEERITLPTTAIVPDASGNPGVLVFNAEGDTDQGSLRWSAVTIEPSQFGEIYVTSGLEGGQEIVATGGGALADGAQVRRFTGFAN